MQAENRQLTVLWPVKEPPQIEETVYSYRFCKKFTHKYCLQRIAHLNWIEYPADGTIDVRAFGDEDLLVITDPEIVISPSALEALLHALDESDHHLACGPQFNISAFPLQQAAISTPYFSLESFSEISNLFFREEDHQVQFVEALDPGCILFGSKAIQMPGKEKTIEGLLQENRKVVVKRALIHRFGDYYQSARADLVQLIPSGVRRILDIGCATGGYAKTIRESFSDIYISGVEPNPVLAETAEPFYDEVIQDRFENIQNPIPYDLVNCGDIIEHLYDPAKGLEKINRMLRPGGYLVISIPNVGHWSILQDLLKGDFQYIPVGLTCISHIRWFGEKSITALLKDSGFKIDIFHRERHEPTPEAERLIRFLCDGGYGNQETLLTNEFLIRAVKR